METKLQLATLHFLIQSIADGPYKICCNDGKLFLKAVRGANDYSCVFVYATSKIEEASSFYIYHTDDEDHPHEFQIVWKGDPDCNKDEASPAMLKGEATTMRYLLAPVSMMGRNSGPLRLESQGFLSNGLFSLNAPLTRSFLKGNENISTKGWLKGSESCLIRCTRRRWCFDGYLAVRTQDQNPHGQQSQQEYVTCCESAPQRKDDGNIFMAFRLLKKSLWADVEPTTAGNQAATHPTSTQTSTGSTECNSTTNKQVTVEEDDEEGSITYIVNYIKI